MTWFHRLILSREEMEENSKVLSGNCLGKRTIAKQQLVYGANRGKTSQKTGNCEVQLQL